MILRIKVPDVFIKNDQPPKIFGDYQCRYISINSNIGKYDNPELDFWTVTSRMLVEYSHDGYSYVFFAPTEYVRKQVAAQEAAARTPPLMKWGLFTGYLLGPPKSAIIIRYRDPNPEWQGSPSQATCYATPHDSEPIKPGELGIYTPEMFGDGMGNFEAGSIGPVNNRSSWPG